MAYRTTNHIHYNQARRIIELDYIVFPYRDNKIISAIGPMVDNIAIKGRFFRMLAGRGCYGKCSFCSVINFYQPHNRIYRSPNNIIDEISYLQNKYDVNHFWFSDEIFYDKSKKGIQWVYEFVNEIKRRNILISFNIEMRPNDINYDEIQLLKDAGLTRIFIGAESGVQRILDEMNKGVTVEENLHAINNIQKADVSVRLGWISVVPTMSFQELIDNYIFLFNTGCIRKKIYIII